ncbi:MAG TPA: aspartate kinase [Bacteroidota bacterium]|nr:aspartate kinase [Bacteroidota bacterium]
MIVMKFGGTSTQDAAAMKNVAAIVKQRLPLKPVVVISAIAQGTNLLERSGKAAADGKPEDARSLVKQLLDRHYAIIESNLSQSSRKNELREFVSRANTELDELIKGVSILRELTPRSLDAFYCYGELLSSRLIAACLCEAGIQAEWVDAKTFMRTDSAFNAAVPVMEVVREKLRAIVTAGIDRGITYVTQGFIGATENGIRTTMGRESSDYSAAVIGAALDVSDVQIWTDVDGVLTADPRTVASPRKVKEMSFQEAYELSFFGAKVLHPGTMIPAIEKNIPIHVFNSRQPQRSGSLIGTAKADSRPVVKSVTSRAPVAVVRLAPLKRQSQYVFWGEVFNTLVAHGVVSRIVTTSENGIALALDDKYVGADLIRELEQIALVTVERNQGIVSLVGSNIQRDPKLLPRIFDAVAGIPASMISSGASGCSFSIVIHEDEVQNAVRRLHAEFFEQAIDAEIFEILDS